MWMGGKIRVLTIGHSYVVALNRAVAREVARDPDFEVTVAAPGFFHGDLRDLALETEPAGSPLRLVELDVQWSRWIHMFHYNHRQLRRLVGGGEFDVVHAWEEPYIYAGFQIARSLAGMITPFCFRTAQSNSKNFPPPFRFFERATLARSQGWIAGGDLVYEAMRTRGYPADRGRILTLAVDTSIFQPIDDFRRLSLRNRLGLRSPVIGYIGRLTSGKGLRVLMLAMDKIGGDRLWSLLLLGSGPLEPEILRWAETRGWSDRVIVVLAKHNDVPSYLGVMDLLVAPSQTMRNWKEQFGRMLIEAFACGVPVLGSDSGEIPYVIGEAGRIIPEEDVEGWAGAIIDLLEQPELRSELAARGMKRCIPYSVATVAEQYRDYYRWLAEQPVLPG
jgi:glycosyltransferase involved in cell wall biosynthesis